MEADKTPIPDFNLFPRCRKVFHFIFDQITAAPDNMSSHNRGGGPALDRALFDEPVVDDGTQT